MRDRIIALIAEVKKDPSLTTRLTAASDMMSEASLDSLRLINLMLLIEAEFEVEIDFDSFHRDHLRTIDRFVEFIAGLPKA
jgi:acyl carrier protein